MDDDLCSFSVPYSSTYYDSEEKTLEGLCNFGASSCWLNGNEKP